jgi:hypothetical protein
MTSNDDLQHEIRVGGLQLICGDVVSIDVIAGNLDGRNFSLPRPGREQTHEQWLAYMAATCGVGLADGQAFQVTDRDGVVQRFGFIGLGTRLQGKDAMTGWGERLTALDVSERIARGERGDDLPVLMEIFGCDYDAACGMIFRGEHEQALSLFIEAAQGSALAVTEHDPATEQPAARG